MNGGRKSDDQGDKSRLRADPKNDAPVFLFGVSPSMEPLKRTKRLVGPAGEGKLQRIRKHRANSAHDGTKGIHGMIPKFLLITSFGGVGAVKRAPIGIIRAIPETRRLIELCMEEVVALARTRQVAIGETAVADSMKSIDTMPANGTTSLHRDILNGKPSELEYWNGAVVRLGRENAVPTPVHELIYDCLLPQELHARGKNDFPH
jgi:2-dehydropantoate 2-reductase